MNDILEALQERLAGLTWRVVGGMTYAQTLGVLGLLLVNYTKAEVDFVGLVELGRHAHDLGEGFFGVLKRAIAVVQDADAIPKLWLLEKDQEQLA